jgi:predicted RNA-binding protein associated with RNAse of E/G family
VENLREHTYLNTPAEVYPKAIRYVDLEVDVCIKPDGTVKILDMEKLEKALEKGFISRKLFEIVKEKVKKTTGALKESKH